jgi:hypothetical protein
MADRHRIERVHFILALSAVFDASIRWLHFVQAWIKSLRSF